MRVCTAIAIFVFASLAGCSTSPLGELLREGEVPGPVSVIMMAPELGIVTDENFRVVDIFPLSSAEKAGVRIGDTLVSIAPDNMLPGTETPPTPAPVPSVTAENEATVVDQADAYDIIANTPMPDAKAPTMVAASATPTAPSEPLLQPATEGMLDPNMEPTTRAVAVATATAGMATVVAQMTEAAATPEVRDPEVMETAEAIATQAFVLEVTSEANLIQRAYTECQEFRPTDATTPQPECIPPEWYTFTDAVSLATEERHVHFVINSRKPSEQMILTVLRDGREIKIAITSAIRDFPDVPSAVTPTQIPDSYHLY